ncbi:non-ribosomal peptide synthetase/MFS transporter [Amycolatopsis vastitatis]|uniref:Non-ribosomal peptide synthetase n=1 Tax=Amycolatopsis vastitatis TaxID=1905142 RepID=A0A229T4L3_9PSEU|nr:non-ribosomal peptide synthetase [Amycolatopsis vastitatis]OXM65719.1 non-ribosomal peptide synthetase [Amycolatopsis vastitatis]
MRQTSLAQNGIWFTERAVDAGSAYHIPLSVVLRGDLDTDALAAACGDVVTRHPLLACGLSESDGVLTLVATDPPVLERAAGTRRELITRPFGDGPLARFILLEGHELLIVVHHLVFDGASKDILLRDLAACYNARVAGTEPELPAAPPDYQEHVEGETERVAAALEGAKAFWATRPLPADVVLPGLDGPPDAHDGEFVKLTLPAGLRESARELGLSQFELLLAAIQALLFRYGNARPSVAIDLSTRTPRHRHAVGVFVNELPIALDAEAATPFRTFGEAVRAELRELYRHWEVPLARAVPGIRPATALAPVSLSYRDRATTPEFTGLESTVDWTEFAFAARNALHFQVVAGDGEPALILQYSSRRIGHADVSRIGEHLRTLLDAVVAAPDTPLGELAMLGETELANVLSAWNDTAADFPETTLTAMIEAQAARTPDAVAVTFEGVELSYADLDARANGIARLLREQGVGTDDVVAICAERSPELVVGLLSVLKAGAAYLPLDPEYPAERLAFMLSDAKPAAILTQRRLLDELPPLERKPIQLDDVVRGERPDPVAGPDNAAYVIYTSGSTGRPKGVVTGHRAIVNRLHWMQKTYGLGADDVVLQKTPVSFDVSVWELFWPLTTGARLTLAKPGGHKDAAYLQSLIAAGVTTVHFVPSMLEVFLAEEDAGAPALRRVICSGEELPADLARRFTGRFPGVELHNLYGPTEAAIDVSHWHCRPDLLDGLTRVPIGRPIDNIRLYVLDADRRLVPPGTPGELHIGGVGVARGYLNRPELTAERFVPDPFEPGARLYRTGDLARHRPDGTLEFLGRIDTQVKIRGQRVELGEIEAALRGSDVRGDVRDAVVALREDRPGDQRLVAYLVGATPRPEELKDRLKRILPDYMVPSAYVTLDAFPLTPNGKLDRKALPAPSPSTADAGGTEPRTDVEKLMAQLWQEVLGLDRVGIDDDFFDLGGHSLLATKVVSRLRRRLPEGSPGITVMDVFAEPTIRELAAMIETPDAESRAGKRLYELTRPIPDHERVVTYIGVPYAGTSAVVFQPLADALPHGCTLFAVALPGHDPGVVEESLPLEEIAQECVGEILERVTGPLVLYSHCLGSALTTEIARRLEAAGREIDAVYVAANFPFALPVRGALGKLGQLTKLKRLRSDRSWANWLRGMGADLEGLPPEEIQLIVKLMREDGANAEDYFSALLDTGAAKLRAPIISVVGERDPITEYYQERYREWQIVTRKTALVVLDEAGHYFLRFRPEELAEIITSTHPALAAGTTDKLTHEARGEDASWWFVEVSEAPDDVPPPRTPQPSLGRFLTVAAGQLVSITGSQLTEYAIPLWIYLTTGSLTSYATSWIFGMLGLFLAPVAGAIVDRCDRRKVMLAADCASGVIQGVFALIYFTGDLKIWQIWIGLGLLSVALVFQRLAYQSAVPQLVPKHFLGHANGVVQLSTGIGQFIAPLLAAAAISLFSLGGILVFDLVSFAVAVAVVAAVRFPRSMPHRHRESLGREIVNGWRYSVGNRYIRGMVAYMGLLNIFLSAVILLIFPLVLSFGSLSTVATVSFLGGIGAALGGLAMSMWGGPGRRRMRGMLTAGVAMGLCGAFAGLHAGVAVVATGLAGMFFCVALVNGIHATIVQVKVPQRYHGRVFALDQMIAWSTIPLGLIVVAPLVIGLFEPLLMPGGGLAASVGAVLGTGPGRGIGFSYVVLGLLIVALGLAALRTRVLSRFDEDMPDALPDDVVGIQALRERRGEGARR